MSGPEQDRGTGRTILVLSALLLALTGAVAWVLVRSSRERARYDDACAALGELIPRTVIRIRERASTGTADRFFDHGGRSTSRDVPMGSARSAWRIELKHLGAEEEGMQTLLDLKIRAELDGVLVKRASGIRIRSAGAPYDAAFIEILTAALRARGLDAAVERDAAP